MSEQSIHEILAPLGHDFRKQADDLLDLREYALSKSNPGRCVSCYFNLFKNTSGIGDNRLAILRKWLETNLEIVAKGDQDKFLERLPLHLDDEDLESFCARIMQEIITNRVYESERIALFFRFKNKSTAA
ncbi:hypothetical protein [Rubellicoccus peritrichatus]|uniref:Uncharacterized protein n=1 Tax=Rubellicoccus peritrichatus TaxID=3080537 RepID=A0AAQ3L962_9BACT|nr:hypothetical protein [Puniceicoccus sp. CR14]WOO41391.1 hypothetical protein RZN69_22455 [Puniceicoccus sp. CR14]